MKVIVCKTVPQQWDVLISSSMSCLFYRPKFNDQLFHINHTAVLKLPTVILMLLLHSSTCTTTSATIHQQPAEWSALGTVDWGCTMKITNIQRTTHRKLSQYWLSLMNKTELNWLFPGPWLRYFPLTSFDLLTFLVFCNQRECCSSKFVSLNYVECGVMTEKPV